MLKNKIKQLRKEFLEVHPESKKPKSSKQEYKYTLDDWTLEDIKKVVFPEGRDLFDPEDEVLAKKWHQTKWIEREFLKLLTVEELKILEAWLEKEQDKRELKRSNH